MYLTRKPGIIERFESEEDEFILYDPVTSGIKLLNQTGAYIWSLIPENEYIHATQINAEMSKKFIDQKINEEQIEDDTKKFILHLIEGGVVLAE